MKLDVDKFLNIRDKEVAYFLGFLWGDGYVLYKPEKSDFRIGLKIALEDSKQIFPIIMKTGDWKARTVNNGGTQQAYIGKNSKQIVEFLKDNDYLIKSGTSPDKILSVIPKTLRSHWWRGYFDADGYICKSWWNVVITSGHDQDWNFFQKLNEHINITGKTRKCVHSKGNSSHFYLVGRYNCIRFLTYIYRDSDECRLARKYDIFMKMVTDQQIKTLNGNAITIRKSRNEFGETGYIPNIGTIKLSKCASLEEAIYSRKCTMKNKYFKQYVEHFPLDFISDDHKY